MVKKMGAIRVKMNATLQAGFKSIKSTRKGVETGIVAFDAVSSQVAANNMQRVFRYSPLFEERHRAAGLHLWYEIKFDESLDPEEVAKWQLSSVAMRLKKHPSFRKYI